MKIDTAFDNNGICSTVTMDLESLSEASFTDEELIRVASNQHLLDWAVGHGGIARVTPRSLRGRDPPGHASISRSGPRITVRLSPFPFGCN